MSRYPGYTASKPGGKITIKEQDSDLLILMNMDSVGDGCPETKSGKGGCGTHIHAGTTCDDSTAVKDHYYNSNVFDSDPWSSVTYISNEDGRSSTLTTLTGGNGYSLEENANHAMVVHDSTGTRIACGLLQLKC